VLSVPVRLPRRARAAAAPVVRHYPTSVTAAAARHRARLAHRRLPSRITVRLLIRRTAREVGLDPALALAVAQQESGFQQRVVSPADAIGVMQVLPATGRWLSTVVGRPLDLLDTEDNVLAGVVLLAVLTRAAPAHLAVAGYYQGLASVRRNGMYPDTRRYVANVLDLRARWR
jgi:soluble lytic murein transglycosylase-like protein